MIRLERKLMNSRYFDIFPVMVIIFSLSFNSVCGSTTVVIWQDDFDDGNLDDWFITGRHYSVSTNAYTNWTGSASATSGQLTFMSENKWEDWTNDRIMNVTNCWYKSETTFGQWSFEMYPAENNFIAIDFIRHLPDASVPEVNPPEYDTTFRYALFILNASYEAGKPGEAFVYGDFESPTGVTEDDFTGEPCFIFVKDKMGEKQTVYAIKEFTTDILTADKLNIQITRDNTSKFTFFVNNEVLFSATDASPPSTSLNTEGYFFCPFSFGGGSWIDNIVVTDTIPVTEESTTEQNGTNEAGILPVLLILGVLSINVRRKKKG